MAAGNTHHEPSHDPHHGHAQPSRHIGAKVTATLVALFLFSLACHMLFAREMLYDWSQSHRNESAAGQPAADHDAPVR